MPFRHTLSIVSISLLGAGPLLSVGSEPATCSSTDTCLSQSPTEVSRSPTELPVIGHVQAPPTAKNYEQIEGEKATEYLDLVDENREGWQAPGRVYEYESVSNPKLPPVPILALGSDDYIENVTRTYTADFSELLQVEYPATSPNLLASFVKIMAGESSITQTSATSQAFYVVKGEGSSNCEHGQISWGPGDLFVVPAMEGNITHHAEETAVIYWVHDGPLLSYLGVKPSEKRFEPTLYKNETLHKTMEIIKNDPDAVTRNRMGILLGNKETSQTKTLSHTLWALLNTIPPHVVQKPHKHNSVALDLCITAGRDTYTLMSRQIDDEGKLVDPVRVDWQPGSMFVTPPGWWHSHINEGDTPGWVLPLQDAGLYTYQRSLDIRFAPQTIAEYKRRRIAGVMDQF